MGKIYDVPIGFELYGYIQVEADSYVEAMEKAWADDLPLPNFNDLDYLPSTWYVDEEKLYDMYGDEDVLEEEELEEELEEEDED